jgi:pyruvate,water dikinase
MLRKEADPPLYLQRNRPVAFADPAQAVSGATLQGVPTSRGVVTGRARVVKEIAGIGEVAEGDILITHSTDPGWTPVFNLLKGLVLETGGLLAHGSCLAREYGLPAVQLPDAMRLIPDGARVTLNGDSGEVLLHEEAMS